MQSSCKCGKQCSISGTGTESQSGGRAPYLVGASKCQKSLVSVHFISVPTSKENLQKGTCIGGGLGPFPGT